MVVETTGTWDLAAAKVLKHMAQAAAARSFNPRRFLQPLAARALRGGSRLASSGGSPPSLRSSTFRLDLSMAGPF